MKLAENSEFVKVVDDKTKLTSVYAIDPTRAYTGKEEVIACADLIASKYSNGWKLRSGMADEEVSALLDQVDNFVEPAKPAFARSRNASYSM